MRQLRRFLKNPVAQKFGGYFVRKIASAFSLDLVTLGYKSIGIMNSRNEYESGEHYLLNVWLKRFLREHTILNPYFFDIGANVGAYSEQLAQVNSDAQIYAFEPQPNIFNLLSSVSVRNPNVHIFNLALGSTVGSVEIYNRESNQSSIHATVYKDVLNEVWGYDDVCGISVPMNTIDNFCHENRIDRIHFIKIDTEGHELQVLKGAKSMLEQGAIDSIQFEFNKMNVFSRVFLHDFFELLLDFNIYRLLPNSLLPIAYESRHEIFMFQNFLAIKRNLNFLKK